MPSPQWLEASRAYRVWTVAAALAQTSPAAKPTNYERRAVWIPCLKRGHVAIMQPDSMLTAIAKHAD